jgi:TldD protein
MLKLTRRELLAGAGAATALSFAQLADARGLLLEPLLDDVVAAALAAAAKAKATYADVRIVRRRQEVIQTREDHVTGVESNQSYGVGVRVIAGGAWGFAASSRVDPKEAARVATLAAETALADSKLLKRPVELAPEPTHVDVWQTPLSKDPFKIPVDQKVELLLAINAEILKVPLVKFANSSVESLGEWKLFASSEGSYIEQNVIRIGPTVRATAIDAKTGEFVSRDHPIQPMQAGWEYIEAARLVADGRRMGEDAVAKLKAPSVEPGKRDLVLSPEHLYLTIHESVGHPTELDRAMGYEANFAGTSFATPDKRNKLKYASTAVTLYADKTTPGGLATCGYDDDGVQTGRWDLVKDGIFVGYQTTREQASWIGEKRSRGTSYAEDFKSFPFQRMPNVSLQPAQSDVRLEQLLAGVDDGIYIEGAGSYSIDHQRYNFQFGGQVFHAIKKGKLAGPLKDVAYHSNTVDFWNRCEAVGGRSSWKLCGALHDGKGEPTQSNAVSHGCPPALFRGIEVLNTNRRRQS